MIIEYTSPAPLGEPLSLPALSRDGKGVHMGNMKGSEPVLQGFGSTTPSCGLRATKSGLDLDKCSVDLHEFGDLSGSVSCEHRIIKTQPETDMDYHLVLTQIQPATQPDDTGQIVALGECS